VQESAAALTDGLVLLHGTQAGRAQVAKRTLGSAGRAKPRVPAYERTAMNTGLFVISHFFTLPSWLRRIRRSVFPAGFPHRSPDRTIFSERRASCRIPDRS
jgi:hypothetical protein